jgi:hypothetical protein
MAELPEFPAEHITVHVPSGERMPEQSLTSLSALSTGGVFWQFGHLPLS